ncbi:acetyl/propionyl/methylcrotonyl-CoA carboxylase subunit alpha [Nocardioides sp.]|uniref:acetyl/propionyl/methylcrotonyl-CoA carboxylase subunit alpha n=1 Tax=Nocardioides sp. TaxID=35761 RepID=UPI003D0FEF6D
MHTLLIANRGEIALRVMRTARRLGLRTVAIHTDLDRSAPHVRAADQSVPVASYLDIDAVVGAALAVGADAIHPGYGFLSERSAFAAAVEAAGLKLVGPSASVMEQMGRKDAAREIAIAAGVPVVPQDATSFPILVKAAAGGGGKGMRIVRTQEEYADAVASARREALSAFGDDTMLVEKYVEHGRHLEVQVMADAHGNVVHLFERDCSTQRRHQKVIEEAPAPTITDETRTLITSAAVALAKQVGYENAGTVEFLLDADTGAAYFLEMNTRLQVEHPVTELVVSTSSTSGSTRSTSGSTSSTSGSTSSTHLDLVELQLRVAAGEPLPFTQDQLGLEGHAIEARIYAEDSFNGFLPQAGTATYVHWPEGVRVDAALESGQVVSTSYDPMLGKVIARGADREAARRALVAALDDTVILGLTTNTGFLRALVASDEFRDATIDTAWLDHHEVTAPSRDLARVFAAWAAAPRATDGVGPFRRDGWRQGAGPAPVYVELDQVVTVAPHAVDGKDVVELAYRDEPDSHVDLRLALDGVAHRARGYVGARAIEMVVDGQRFVFERPDVFGDHGPVAGDGTLVAPMPGTVLAVHVAEGAAVVEGETLGVMEAMKMELALKAPFAGTVTEVGAATGEQVSLGAVLFVVEA